MHIDSSYRLLLANEVMVRDLLALPELNFLASTIDLNTLVPVPADMVSNTGTQRRGDLVWQARTSGGAGQSVSRHPGPDQRPELHQDPHPHVYVHIEHQSSSDPRMALRMLTYRGLIYEATLQGKPCSKWLPAMIPVVLYSGEERWRVDTEVRNLIVPVDNQLESFQPKLKYYLIDQRRLVERWVRTRCKASRDDKLDDQLDDRRDNQRDNQCETHARANDSGQDVDSADLSNNLAYLLFRLEHNDGVDDAVELLRQVDRLTAQPGHEQLRKAFGCWVHTVLLRHVMTSREDQDSFSQASFREMIDMLAERSHGWHNKWLREGMEKGIEQGIERGRENALRHMLRAMLVQKFGSIDDSVQNRLEQASLALIEQWTLNILNASQIEDVFRS